MFYGIFCCASVNSKKKLQDSFSIDCWSEATGAAATKGHTQVLIIILELRQRKSHTIDPNVC